MNPKARVTRDIVDLVPAFLHRRQQEIESLRIAVATGDPIHLRNLGQRMCAVGDPYGFTQITSLGRQILQATDHGELDLIRSLIEQYADYLQSVEIVHVDVPVPTWMDSLPPAAPAGA